MKKQKRKLNSKNYGIVSGNLQQRIDWINRNNLSIITIIVNARTHMEDGSVEQHVTIVYQ